MLNYIYILLKLHPDWDWNWSKLAGNPNITWEMIQEFPNLKTNLAQNQSLTQTLNWDYISLNVNITWETIWELPDKNWNYSYLSGIMVNITQEFLNSNKVDWYWLSGNPNLTQEIYFKYPYKSWNYNILSTQKWLTWELVLEDSELWSWYNLVQNKYLTRDIDKTWQILHSKLGLKYYSDINPDHWCYVSLSQNPNLTWSIISQNLDKPWSWAYISENIDIEIIKKNPDHNWRYVYLSGNPTLTWSFIKKNLDKNWSWLEISRKFINSKRYFKYREKIKETIYTGLNIEPGDIFKYLDHSYIINDKKYIDRFIGYHPNVKSFNLKYKYFNLWLKKVRKIKTQKLRWQGEFNSSLDLVFNFKPKN